ncbi:peptidoglycan editing factor PgeF [Kineosporia rhizophila]|uniref:peptidoglycan editing factor PgeF n=1 Tax=Kineosporia TaxID=49184 RepID=UPI001E37D294|nr:MULTISPECIES: peptidoglycan editing factor PgeF [Kineosporia]MCE0533998.1 peptidoglycan editing factor PgeF [Kineosporia rhizophila]GLY13538.1 laccase domain protein [Kineosporia sp. NBRC 101677]
MIAAPTTDVPLLTWSIFAGHGVRAAVTTREGGVSSGRYASLNLGMHVQDDPQAVQTNRERTAAAFGVRPQQLVFAKQVHGRGVATVTALTAAGPGIEADAMITTEPGPVLVIMVADCVPLVLFDPVRRVAAAVHAGWPGTVAGVTRETVRRLAEGGSDPADLLVGIGPSISPDRYQVGADVEQQARQAFGARADEVVRPDGTGRWLFDLWRANTIQLTEAGVRPEAIELAGLDTGPGTPFFSHRSEGPTGRFAVLVQLTHPNTTPNQPEEDSR